MTDQDVRTEWQVCIVGYGQPDKVTADHALTLARALHTAFGDHATLLRVERAVLLYDPFADDGNHPGNAAPIVAVPDPDP